jgi:predicted PurR-regulated permease PerM
MPEPRSRLDIHVHLPTATILKGMVAALLAWVVWRLWPEVVFLTISILLAIALGPLVTWMGRRGISRSLSVALLAGLIIGAIAAFAVFVLPPFVSQAVTLVADLPGFRERIEHRLPPDDTALRTVVDQLFRLPESPEVRAQLDKPLIWGRSAASAFTTTGFVLIATLYLLLDGRRLYAWLLAFVPRKHRDRMAQTVSEVSDVVYAFVRGQATISFLFTTFTAVLLEILGVPAVLPLALFAGACDVIPVVGIFIATAPAALLALTVSPTAALIVVCAYIGYHFFETYFLLPRIYGSSMRLSALGVFLALIIGGTLQGLLGAVLVLPVVAAYPIVERIWLRGYLAREVIEDHQALTAALETGSEAEVDAILQGEEHPGGIRITRPSRQPALMTPTPNPPPTSPPSPRDHPSQPRGVPRAS